MSASSPGLRFRFAVLVAAWFMFVPGCGDQGGNSRPPPPENDGFDDALVLTEIAGVSTLDTSGATKQPGEPDHAGAEGGASLWWTFEAPANGTMRVRTSGSTFDTLLAIYTGNAIGSLTEIGADDDGGGGTASDLSVLVTGGTIYHLAVDGRDAATGTLRLDWQFTPAAEVFEVVVKRAGQGSGTVTSLPSGIDCGSNCAATFTAGTHLTLAADPASDSVFVGWTGDCSGIGACEFEVDQEANLTATFDLLPGGPGPDPEEEAMLRLVVTPNSATWVVLEGSASGSLVATGSGDHELSVAPGTYFVEFRAQDYEPAATTITLFEGDDETIAVTLSAIPSPTVVWRLSRDNVSASADVGETASVETLEIFNDGNAQGTYAVTDLPPWADINPSSGVVDPGGSDHDTLAVTFDLCTEVGVKQAKATIAGGGDDETVVLRHVCNEADIVRWRVEPLELRGTAEVGKAPAAASLRVYNDGNVAGTFELEGLPAWASFAPERGTVDGGSDDYAEISVEYATCAAVGTEATTITIGGDGDTATVHLVRVCTEPPFVMWQPNLSTVGSSADVGFSPASKKLRIYNAGTGAGAYDISSVPSWASVSPTTGKVDAGGQDFDEVIVTFASCVAASAYKDDITISGDGDTVTVTLQRTCREAATTGDIEISLVGLPEGVGANAVLSGPAGTIRTITSSTLIEDLDAGTYLLHAGTVVVGHSAYEPTSHSRTIEVAAGARSIVGIEYEEMATMSMVPASTTCVATTPIGGTCAVDIALVNSTTGWQAFQVGVGSDDFSVVGAAGGELIDGSNCSLRHSSTSVGAVCLNTFNGDGVFVTVTLERNGQGPSRVATSDATLSAIRNGAAADAQPTTGSLVVP